MKNNFIFNKYLTSILFLFITINAIAQPTVLYSSINTSPRVAMTDLGLFKQGRMQANQSGFQRWAMHIGSTSIPDYSQNWRVGSTPNVLSYGNFIPVGYANGANYFSGGGGIDGELNTVVSGNYYTFNIMKIGAVSSDMELLETSYNPAIISSVTQMPSAVIANTSVAITITMATTPATGENVFLRYSTDGYVSSSLIQISFTGNTGTVNIPCKVAGTTVSYYAFSSNETLAGINSDLTAFGNNCYDMATLNINNNGGPNYSYTVTIPTTNTILYSASPYCSNAGTATVTNTGTLGGAYSSPAGLSINSTTGAINLATSTAGTYTVTYSIAASGSCALYTATTAITITTAPSAIISYNGTPYCSNVATATITRTGTTGGSYSSTAGLSINAITGDVNIATSIAGTYTVTYALVAAGGCAPFTTTTIITITAAPSATILYNASPYCSNSGTANVTSTGTATGVFSSTAGLSINAITGAITLASSTVGTYIVTYKVIAAGGCAVFSTTAPITITAAASATIAYTGSPFCSNITTGAVTRTGTAGGTYSSTTGLVINTTTGEIDIAASTVGTYTITYTIAANAGCTVFTTPTNITINAISIAPTSATASTTLICGNSGSVNLTAIGGTLSTGAFYKWYAGSCGGTLIGTGATLTNVFLNSTTTYFIRIEGLCNTTSCQSVTVNVAPQPIVEITVAPPSGVTPAAPVTIIATVSPIDNYNYAWTKNVTTNLNINANKIIVQANDAGNYLVKVTAPSGCTATSINAFVFSAISSNLFIFPSPNNGLFNVSYNNGASNLNGRTINIYDSKAAKVYSQSYNNFVPYSNMKVDMRGYAKGTYFVMLVDATGKELATGKVLVY